MAATKKSLSHATETTALLADSAEVEPYDPALGSVVAGEYALDNGNDDDEEYLSSTSASRVLAHKKQNLAKITIVAMVYFTSYTISISPQLILLISKICRDKYPYSYSSISPGLATSSGDGAFSAQHCDSNKAQQLNSQITSLLLFSQAFLCIMVSGKVGEFSDVHGRKLTLAICLSVATISAIGTTFLLTDYVPFNMWLALGVALIQATTGGMKSIMSIMRSYVLDIVEPSERVASLSIVTGTLFFGVALGPLISTFLNKLSGGNDFVAMFVHCGGLVFSVLCLVLFVPETHFAHHKKQQQQHQHQKSPASISGLFKSLKLFWIRKTPQNPNPWGKRIRIFILLSVDLLSNTALITMVQVAVLYSTLVFKWGSTQVGYLLSVSGLFKAFNSFILIPAFMKYLRKRGYVTDSDSEKATLSKADVYIMRSATVISLAETVLIITATRPRAIYLATIVGSFATINISTIQSCIVKLCSENVMHQDGRSDTKIGELFGALSLLENISMMCISSSVIMVFSRTVGTKPKTCFVVLFLIIALTSSFTLLLKSEHKVSLRDDNGSFVGDSDDDE